MKRLVVYYLLYFSPLMLFSQLYVLPNEKEVFSFETENGKKMVLAQDKSSKYLVYRFGTKEKVELEYPTKDKLSWKKFSYSSYHRGGAGKNEGMDNNYLYFTNNNFKYVIYDNFVSAGDGFGYFVGIKVINLKTKKTTDIPAKHGTRQGELFLFKKNKLVTQGEEYFD